MAGGHEIDFYYKWAVLIPVTVGCLVVAVAILPMVLVYLIDRCSCNHFTNFFFVYSKVIYRDALKKKKNPPRILFHGYEISRWNVVQFATVISIFIFTVFVSFWTSFLIESSYTCNPTLDCFLRNSTPWIYGQMPRKITDCDDVDPSVTVVCYQFVLNATKGFSSAVGFLAVAVMYIYVYGYLLVWLMELSLSPKVTSVPVKLCSIVVWFLVIVFPLTVAIAAAVVMYSDKTLVELTFKNFESELIFITYWLFFVYSGPISAVLTSFSLLKKVKAEMLRELESDCDLRVSLTLNEKESDLSSQSGTKPLLQGKPSTYESVVA